MIIVVMGVAGVGKTTIGTRLAAALRCGFLEGDALHTPASVDKMSRGVPLTSADRAPWLAAIHARLVDAFRRGRCLVVACSALEQSSRAVLAQEVPITWVHLRGAPGLLRSRVRQRRGHYMREGLLASQFQTLEEPVDAIVVDVAQPPALIVEQVLAALRGVSD
jgi:gluconokinase